MAGEVRLFEHPDSRDAAPFHCYGRFRRDGENGVWREERHARQPLRAWRGAHPVCDTTRGMQRWWAQQDSNLRPADYESAALTN